MKFTRQRYQYGSLSRESRKAGSDVWIFRWRESTPESRVNRKRLIGTVEQYPNKTAAKRAVESLRLTINAASAAVPVTIEQLVKHYEQYELPSKAYSTQRTWKGCLKTHVLPSWGGHRLSEVKTVEVELWLRNLPLANATKAKIRNVMHVIFAHACRHEWLMRNPISLVRQSAKRKKTPDVLEVVELKKLIAELQNPARILVFLTVTTGLRISEAMGLRWSDIDFSAGDLNLTRAVVHQHVGELKTEASNKPVPMDASLATALLDWRTQTPYRQPEDWVFASPKMKGKQPYWPETPLECFVQPAAERLGIRKRIGWHIFRRTYATLLNASSGDPKTLQELMRHSNSRLTLDVYAQALTPEKRAAQKKVVEMIRPSEGTTIVPLCSHAEQQVACK